MNKYIVTVLMPLLMMNSCVINNNSSSSSSISTSSSSSYFNPYEYIKDSNIESLKEILPEPLKSNIVLAYQTYSKNPENLKILSRAKAQYDKDLEADKEFMQSL